ncbi:unnamed protein product [Rotaria sordida]|uniref:Uncharacterized protein n=2 Tax=Rotaria sordida TaxID=392033 RepID=A0A815JPF2_9BILA|nr:unnamed protein product [Rotaria sordida]
MTEKGSCTDITCDDEIKELYHCHCCLRLVCLTHLIRHVEITKQNKQRLDSLRNELNTVINTLKLIVEEKLITIKREQNLIEQANKFLDAPNSSIDELQNIFEQINQTIVSNRSEEMILKVEPSLSETKYCSCVYKCNMEHMNSNDALGNEVYFLSLKTDRKQINQSTDLNEERVHSSQEILINKIKTLENQVQIIQNQQSNMFEYLEYLMNGIKKIGGDDIEMPKLLHQNSELLYIFKTRILLLEMEYIPCVVLINLERKTIDSVRSDPFDQLFRSNNFIYKTQLCGCLQGFQMCHSLDNRIESGIMMRFNVIPSSKVSEIVVEPTIFHDRISMKEVDQHMLNI